MKSFKMNVLTVLLVSLFLYFGSCASDSLQATSSRMKSDTNGYFHIGADGVLRSFSAEGLVLDATPLSNAALLSLTDRLPNQVPNPKGPHGPPAQLPPAHTPPNNDTSPLFGIGAECVPGVTCPKEHLKSVWADIDGNNVAKEQLMTPPADILPFPVKYPELAKLEANGVAVDTSPAPSSILEKNQAGYYCLYKACTTSAACIFMRCVGCFYADAYHLGICMD